MNSIFVSATSTADSRICEIVVMMGALTIGVLSTGCDRNASNQSNRTGGDPNMTQNDQLERLTKTLAVRFPEGTRVVAMRGDESGPDHMLQAKLQFPSAGLDAFIASTPLAGELFDDSRRYLLGPDDGWWDPSAPATLPTASAELPGAKVLHLGTDKSDPESVTLYIVCHET
jgi:hypothetical protein